MSRIPKITRGPQRYGSITYPVLAEWTGLGVQTLRQYAHTGEFDPAKLVETLKWVNTRRQKAGLPLIGMPTDKNSGIPPSDTLDSGTPDENPYNYSVLTPGYDPATAEFPE